MLLRTHLALCCLLLLALALPPGCGAGTAATRFAGMVFAETAAGYIADQVRHDQKMQHERELHMFRSAVGTPQVTAIPNQWGGANFYDPVGRLIGFSAYHWPTNQIHFFDPWGRRIG